LPHRQGEASRSGLSEPPSIATASFGAVVERAGPPLWVWGCWLLDQVVDAGESGP